MSEQEKTAGEAANEAEKTLDPLAELEQAKLQATGFLEGWQRERAEFANYRRRIEQQQRDGYQNATAEVLLKILPIVDDFARAVENIPPELQSNPWVSGTAMILPKFNKVLDGFGVRLIDPSGEIFDPNMHEAIAMEDSDSVESGHVIQVMQKGYAVGDRLLRPALVKVAR